MKKTLLGLTAIGLIAITTGAFAQTQMMARAMSSLRSNTTVDAINIMLQKARSSFDSSGSYEGLGSWASDDSIGDRSSVAGSIINQATGNSREVFKMGETPSQNGYGQGMYIGISNLQPATCMNIASKDWQSYGSEFVGIGFNDEYPSSSLTIPEIQNGCNAIGSDGYIVLYFDPSS